MIDDYSWTQEMTVVIRHKGCVVMKISLHEAIESAGYKNVMKHVRECNNTPWLKRWQEERQDEVVGILSNSHDK